MEEVEGVGLGVRLEVGERVLEADTVEVGVGEEDTVLLVEAVMEAVAEPVMVVVGVTDTVLVVEGVWLGVGLGLA